MRSVQLASLLLLACGGGSVHHLADGSPDTPRMIDAPNPDAPAIGVVSVVVTLQGKPASGVTVYFQNADSTLVMEGTTDATGTASATMAAGGFVTVVEPQLAVAVTGGPGGRPAATVAPPSNQGLATFAGVKPGDVLHDDVDPLGTTLVGTTVTISISPDSNPLVAEYVVRNTCDDGAEPVFFAVGSAGAINPVTQTLDNCGSSADMVVIAEDSSGNALDAFTAANVAIVQNGSISLKGAYAPIAQQQIDVTDVPPEVSAIDVSDQLSSARGEYFVSPLAEAFVTGDTTGSASLPAPTVGTDTLVLAYDLFPQGSISDRQLFADWGPPGTTPVSFDVGARRMRNWVTRPQLDPTKEQVTWEVATAGNAPDWLETIVAASRTETTTTASWTWRIASPGAADGDVAFPSLPTDLFDFNFRDTDSIALDALEAIITPGGYDAARAQAFNVGPLIAGFEAAGPGSFAVQLDQAAVSVTRGKSRPALPWRPFRPATLAR